MESKEKAHNGLSAKTTIELEEKSSIIVADTVF